MKSAIALVLCCLAIAHGFPGQYGYAPKKHMPVKKIIPVPVIPMAKIVHVPVKPIIPVPVKPVVPVIHKPIIPVKPVIPVMHKPIYPMIPKGEYWNKSIFLQSEFYNHFL